MSEKCDFCTQPAVTLVAACGDHAKLLESIKPKKRRKKEVVPSK